ncbi:hypothetical protein DIPPA_15895 [Diplonema papillatum]|nr:hypothetical protein DIPPA_15895 [Diplonema papillatum]
MIDLFFSDESLRDFPWYTALTVLISVGIAIGLSYSYFEQSQQRELGKRCGEVIHAVCGKEGTLWRCLHPSAREKCEKPIVNALERAIHKQLGKPETIHTSTLRRQDSAPPGFDACSVEVTFQRGRALMCLCWEQGAKRLGAIEVSPEAGPLLVHDHINGTVFEQKTDAFITNLLSGRIASAFAAMHQNLQDKLSGEALVNQKTSVLTHMGHRPSSTYEPDTTFHSTTVESLSGLKVTKLTVTLAGEKQDSDGVFYWVLDSMDCKLIKFEIKTTGKAKRETVFVHPDGTRIDAVA